MTPSRTQYQGAGWMDGCKWKACAAVDVECLFCTMPKQKPVLYYTIEEDEVCFAVLDWLKYNPKERYPHMHDVFKITISGVDGGELCK
jgi:hypothetical protein